MGRITPVVDISLLSEVARKPLGGAPHAATRNIWQFILLILFGVRFIQEMQFTDVAGKHLLVTICACPNRFAPRRFSNEQLRQAEDVLCDLIDIGVAVRGSGLTGSELAKLLARCRDC